MASAFAIHLIDLEATGRREELPAVFDLLEAMHIDGDAYVSNLATVGFLEDLANGNLYSDHYPLQPEVFLQYLQPHSKWWWEEVELFWAGRAMPLGSSGRAKPE